MKKICRVCGNRKLELVWDFGMSPLANSFKSRIDQPEVFYPLTVNYCPSCQNVQSGYVVDPDLLFKHYLYTSSTSKVFVNHFEEFAHSIGYVDTVVDIGSNDGILLKPFKKLGSVVIGVDPAKNIKSGIPTIHEYFTRNTANKIGQADLVTCMNTFAHIDNLDEIVKGVKILIKDNGMFVLEVQYLMDQLEFKYFDNVYHEHVQFWSVTALKKFLENRGLYVWDVEHVNTHGGSIRVYCKTKKSASSTVGKFLHQEENVYDKIKSFKLEIMRNKEQLMRLLYNLKNEKKIIIGYGAPAKSTTFLNYFGIGNDILDYIVDDSKLKQGLYTPGTNIPIYRSIRGTPDYVLILAWNFADSIMNNHPGYRYIIPCPKIKIC